MWAILIPGPLGKQFQMLAPAEDLDQVLHTQAQLALREPERAGILRAVGAWSSIPIGAFMSDPLLCSPGAMRVLCLPLLLSLLCSRHVLGLQCHSCHGIQDSGQCLPTECPEGFVCFKAILSVAEGYGRPWPGLQRPFMVGRAPGPPAGGLLLILAPALLWALL
ncbi:lymphocyte antigen 6H-like [Marmota flaviventris]|uniref:lymphocyte antigen 6H-like n=1 Tax=Marmota flaviventris TaxID=93162 RepID=UPI003A85525E